MANNLPAIKAILTVVCTVSLQCSLHHLGLGLLEAIDPERMREVFDAHENDEGLLGLYHGNSPGGEFQEHIEDVQFVALVQPRRHIARMAVPALQQQVPIR